MRKQTGPTDDLEQFFRLLHAVLLQQGMPES